MRNAVVSFLGLSLICFAVIYLAYQGDPQWQVGFYCMSFFAILSQIQIMCMYKVIEYTKMEQTK